MEVKVISGRRVTVPEATAIRRGIEEGDVLDITINEVYKRNNGLAVLPFGEGGKRGSSESSPLLERKNNEKRDG